MFKPITNLYQVNQVRELDHKAIYQHKIIGFTLMQRAGEAVFMALKQRWPRAKRIIVVCGKGNNAGDGYVIAKFAKQAKLKVEVLYLAEPNSLTGDAAKSYEECEKHKIKVKPFSPELLQADIVVDALLGTGLSGEIREEFKVAIEAINSSGIPIVAVDIPSGLNGDTGNPLGVAVRADMTVTFVGAKQGLFTGKAADYCGEVKFTDLGVPQEVYENSQPSAELIDAAAFKLPPRAKTAHKGKFGTVLVVGGDYGMVGAARMAGEAALRTGAGIGIVATRPEHITAVSGMRPELLCYGITEGWQLEPLIERATVVVFGPGVGISDWSRSLLAEMLKHDKPILIDADGLNLLAQKLVTNNNWILTPHPGEAARLLNCSTANIEADRFSAVRSLQNKYKGIALLKGAGTLIAGEPGPVSIAPFANPAMASGGMGDILSGIIGGLIAQGMDLQDAACFGVVMHAKAAELAAQKYGERGVLATDLFGFLHE